MAVYKCTAFKSGDGWKDTTKVGDVHFAYGYELPKPYEPGQYRVVCYPVSAVTREQWSFRKLSRWETLKMLPKMRKDIRWHGFKKWVKMMRAKPTTPPEKDK